MRGARIALLIGSAAASIGEVVVLKYGDDSGELYFWWFWLWLLSGFWWVYQDRQSNAHRTTYELEQILWMLPYVAIPAYLFGSHGWLRGTFYGSSWLFLLLFPALVSSLVFEVWDVP